MMLRKFAAVAVMTLMASGAALAQQKGQGAQNNQGGKNQGAAQGQGWHLGWYHQTPWFSQQGVRDQLKLNDEQFNRLNKVYGESWTRYNQGMSDLGKLDENQRSERVGELSRTFETDFNKAASDVLNPQQQERFRQMWFQHYPYSAFNNPEIQRKLNLTDEQRQQISKFGQQYQQQMSGIYKSMDSDYDAASKQYGSLRKQTSEQINNILNQQQQQAWRGLTGDPYNFTLPKTSKQ